MVSNQLRRIWLVIFALLVLTACQAFGDSLSNSVPIVCNGRAQAVILIPDNDSCCGYAASELVDHVRLITGATLPIEKLTDKADIQSLKNTWPGKTLVALGVESAKLAGVDVAAPSQVDGFHIEVRPGVVAIVGRDDAVFDANYTWVPGSAGTLYGVYHVLRGWGVRWLDAGELGTDLPHLNTLTLAEQSVTVSPRFPYRFLSYGKDQMQWLRRIGAGGDRDPWATKHTFEQTIDFYGKYGKTHPEYFTIDAQGHRTHEIALGHPQVVDVITQEAREYFKSNRPPGLQKYFMVIPPDGEYYCYCNICRPQIDRKRGNTGNMSNLVARAVVEVARRLEKEFPDHYIVYCAYSNYKQPPTFLEKLPPNVVVLISQSRHDLYTPQAIEQSDEILAGWQKLKPHAIYFCRYYNNTLGTIPQVMGTIISRDLGYLADAGTDLTPVMGEMNFGPADPSIPGGWYNNFNLYVTGIYLWNPNATLPRIIEDYCRHAYGPAAKPMEAFWTRLDALNQDPQQRQIFSADSIEELDRMLQHAIAAAPTKSVYARRLAIVEEGFAPLRAVRSRLLAPGTGDPLQDLAAYPIAHEAVRFSGKASGRAIEPVKVDGAYTVAAWIRPARLLEQGAYDLLGGSEKHHFALRIEDGRLYLLHQTRQSGWNGIEMLWSPVLDLRPGNWYHVAASFDPKDGMTLYLDGRVLAMDMSKQRLAAYPITTVGARGIGSFDLCFPGEMAEVRIYLRQLSVSEVRILAQTRP